MKFESKYDVGNTPWFMKNNKPIQCRISSITLWKSDHNGSINYTAEKIDHPVSWIDYQDLQENCLYLTKELLLASL